MDDLNLSPELAELEARLRGLAPAELDPRFRQRLLRAASQQRHFEGRRDWVRYATAIAALWLLWVNLSWIASRETAHRVPETRDLADTTARIQALLPELPPAEAARQALLLNRGHTTTAPASAVPRGRAASF